MEVRSTNLLRLLSTNEAPTTVEAASIQQEKDTIATQIRALEIRFRQYQAILNPLRRVPTEILGEIFKLTAEEEAEDAQKAQILALCLVCRAWRDAAYLTHSLWGRLSIKLSPSLSYDAIKGWLLRAPQRSRTLTVVETGEDGCVEGSATDLSQPPRNHAVSGCQWRSAPLAKILSTGPPLHSLHLSMSSSYCLQEMISTMQLFRTQGQALAFESIESLSLTWRRDSLWEEPPQLSQSLYAHLPILSSLHMSLPLEEHVRGDLAVWVPSEPFLIHVPPITLENLTSFSLKCNWDSPSTMLALEHCANLETLCLDFQGFSTFWSGIPESSVVRRLLESPVRLPGLHTLKALNMYSPHASQCMPFLQVPALMHLHVSFSVYDDVDEGADDTGRSFMAFVDSISVGCPGFKGRLRSLVIARDLEIEKIAASDLSAILTSFPSLRRLALDYLCFKPSELSEEICTLTLLLPALECLELANLSGEFDLGGMLRFLVACRRLGGLAKLETLNIGYAKPLYMRSRLVDQECGIEEDVSMAQSLASLGITLQGHMCTMDRELRFALEQ